SYALSTASHGIRRRSAASASRERVKAFSFRRSCRRAASHSCCDTIGGVFIARRHFPCSLSLSLLVAILFLLCLLKQTETIRRKLRSRLSVAATPQRQRPPRSAARKLRTGAQAFWLLLCARPLLFAGTRDRGKF